MAEPLLDNAYQRRYYDVDVECQLVATVTKRIYIDEMAQYIDEYYDSEHLDRYHKIIAEEVGEEEFHNNNQKFAELHAPEEVTDDDIFEVMQTTDTFVTGSEEGKETCGDEIWRCVICRKHFTGFGNNPEPIKPSGDCCDACNTNQVIPARMSELFESNQVEQ